MATNKNLKYRGDLEAGVGFGSTLLFVTTHPEGQGTALYRLNASTWALDASALPCGASALVLAGEEVFVAARDGHLYAGAQEKGALAPRGAALEAPAAALAALEGGRLAAACGEAVVIVAASSGAVLQRLELASAGTSLAADPTGRWLAVGMASGDVAVFEAEGQPTFAPSASARLHEGAVVGLLFEEEELRFFSIGHDQRLLSTHARGALEAEDRGKGGGHEDRPTAILMGPGERFYTAGLDATIKAWPKGRSGRPATQRDELARVGGLARVTLEGRNHLVALCKDNTLRFFLLDTQGKIGQREALIAGAQAWLAAELASGDVKRREAALQEARAWSDAPSLDALYNAANSDGDHALRRLSAELIAATQHPRALNHLYSLFGHREEAVRRAAFQGATGLRGDAPLEPIGRALDAGHKDIGVEAIRALTPLAKADEVAFERLLAALQGHPAEVRQAALEALEAVTPAASPEGTLLGLRSSHADVRRLALVRLYQRGMLAEARVQAALRRSAEDSDGDVRRAAFLILVLSRPALAEALRARDKDLHRSLYELEHFGKELPEGELPKVKAKKLALGEEDWRPLLDAMASGNLDTCLAGVSGMALLGDPRAFGILLQLSREPSEQARVYVCRALAQLGDMRSVDRLRTMLRDGATSVRDAAFSALAALHEDAPLKAAEAGLEVEFEDVRRRALQVLARELKAHPAKKGEETPAVALIRRVLNDSFPAIRAEAFKTVLNQKIGGGGLDTLRFILRSVHADVRREVLTEAMASVKEAWAWGLLLEFLADPDSKLRAEAFDFLVGKSKGRELEPLEAGLRSPYADIRLKATQGLVAKHNKASRALLESALEDGDASIRQIAIDALVVARAEDALRRAMGSSRPDVRAKAASARALWGDRDALEPLLSILAEEEPEEKAAKEAWLGRVRVALEGLAALEDRGAVAPALKVLEHKDSGLRRGAAEVLAWCATAEDEAALQEALRHQDKAVRALAALGLAFIGVSMATTILFSPESRKALSDEHLLCGALALGEVAEPHLVAFLDHSDASIRRRALLVLLFLEACENDGVPDRCLAGLASSDHRTRLMAAQGLEAFPDHAAFLSFLVELLNERDDNKPWTISAEITGALGEIIAHGPPRLKARAAMLLGHLGAEKQKGFDEAWKLLRRRHEATVEGLVAAGAKRAAPKARYTDDQIRQIVFGAYVGLARNQDRTSHTWSGGPPVNPARVRQTALRRLEALAGVEGGYRLPAQATFVQSLRDANAEVRAQAFEQLERLGVSAEALGAEALSAGIMDVGVLGLKLLSASAAGGQGDAVLEGVMMSNTDGLEREAATLLRERQGLVPTARKALEAASATLRGEAVSWLVQAGPEDAAAVALLREACASRFKQVRFAAALQLAYRGDAAGLEVLGDKLRQDAYYEQYETVNALQRINAPRVAELLLDRVLNDPAKTANTYYLFNALGQTRSAAVVEPLLAALERPEQRYEKINALIAISGFDQWNPDPEDEAADTSWEARQHPRRGDVLAKLMLRLNALGEHGWWGTLLPHARWCRTAEVDAALTALAGSPRDDVRAPAVEALGWRVRRRGAAVEPLLTALQHAHPDTRFFAAEALARVQRAEGLTVLMTSAELLDRFDLRERAVAALGELADPRALDLLLGWATEEEHALQEASAEAIGHLGQSDRAEAIFKALERLARGDGGVALAALKGLRYFNTRAAWQLIRERAEDTSLWFRHEIIALLGYNDDPTTRELLLRLAAEEEDWDNTEAVRDALRRLYGPDDIAPDLALARNALFWEDEDSDAEVLQRITTRATAAQLLELLPRLAAADAQQRVQTALLTRGDLEASAQVAALSSPHPVVAETAARLLGRSRQGADALASAGASVSARWAELRLRREQRQGGADELEAWTSALRWILWAQGRAGGAEDALVSAARAHAGISAWRPVRREAIYALLTRDAAGPAVVELLRELAVGEDAELRAAASSALVALDAAAGGEVAAQVVGDPVAMARLARAGAAVEVAARSAAAVVHYQGVALPRLVAAGDLAGLQRLALDASLSDVTRSGAVEALALLGQQAAEDTLASIGKDEANEVELRKAAWRALRRSRRQRASAAQRAEGRG